MALFRMIMKEIGGRFQNAAGSINSDKNMYAGAKGCAPSDKLAGGMGGMSGGTGNISAGNLMGGAGASGMGAGDASSGVDFSSMGEAASAMA
ncbi:MAG: hypothetical protein J6S67_02655 [Methanobrevibacter sp.]|nr:hypothetical protein [Methanobrevibacter sp.]